MTTSNKSGLRPVGHAVLIQPYEPEFQRSVIVIPDFVSEGTKMRESRGIVMEVGSSAWDDEKQPRAKVGDKVMISKYVGALVTGPADNKLYRMINDRDIFCVIEAEETVQAKEESEAHG